MSAVDAAGNGRLGTAAPVPGCLPWFLVAGLGQPAERRYEFYDRLEIGRDDAQAEPAPS